jgi:para-nitrobenzyl esterase
MSDTLVVATTAGRVRGHADGATTAFLGIPYAAPPVGPLRFAAPAPAQRWTAIRDADAFGPAAPQPDRPIGRWFHGPTPATAEDCLSLNVWTPPGVADDKRPVLVWLHGGGWALGFSGSPLFAGARLAAAADAVVVTINYRLGSLGWLNHPQLAATPGGAAANWGLQDHVAALGWVRDNIAGFGGDPGAVTVWGQSAGAGSVLHLLVSPLADGLFARAIAQSPPLGELVVPASRGHAWAQALSGRLGATAEPIDLEALRGAPAGAVVDAHEALLATPEFRGTRGGAMPVIDAATLPVDPRRAPAARPEVPVLIGTAADEATFLFRAAGRVVEPDDDGLRAMVAHLPDVEGDSAADTLIAAQREAGQDDNNAILCRVATQQLFAGPVAEWASARTDAAATVYRYRVEHRSPDERLGAVHAIDVPLVFGTHDHEIGAAVAGDDAQAARVSGEMTAAWRSFVHGGAPWDADELTVFGGPR